MHEVGLYNYTIIVSYNSMVDSILPRPCDKNYQFFHQPLLGKFCLEKSGEVLASFVVPTLTHLKFVIVLGKSVVLPAQQLIYQEQDKEPIPSTCSI